MPDFLSPQNSLTLKAKTPVVLPGLATSIGGIQGFTTWGLEDSPFLVTSMAEFEDFAGPRNATYPMVYDSAIAYFNQGGRQLYVNRTIGASAAKATVTIQANSQDLMVFSGRYKGLRGNTIARKITRTSAPAGTVGAVVAAGSATVIPVSAPGKFSVGDQVLITEGASNLRGIVTAINGNTIVLAGAITVPVGGYTTATTITIEHFTLEVYDNNLLKKSYFFLQSSPLSAKHFATVVGNDSYRLADATLFSPAPTFAANIDTRPANDTNPVLLTGGTDGSALTDSDLKGSSSSYTGIWAWDKVREVVFLAIPGAMSLSGITVAVYKELEVYEIYRQTRQPIQAIIDPPQGLSPSAMKTWWTTTLAATSRGVATWFPWLIVKDPVTSAQVARPPSAFVMGRIAAAHRDANIAQPAAGETFGDLVGVIATDLATPLQEGDARYDDLYPVGINVIIRVDAQSPARLFGNTTANVNGAFGEFHVVTVFAIIWRELKRRTSFVNFKSNNKDTRDKVELVSKGYLRGLYKAGVLDGNNENEAFYSICDDSNNTAQVKASRKLVARHGANVVHAVEFADQTLEQDTRAVDAEIGLGQERG